MTMYLQQWQGRRVLITGASGFLGRKVTQIGAQAGIHVHTLSRSGTVRSDVTAHLADITDAAQVTAIIQSVQPDAVLHLATAGVSYGPRDLITLLNTNVNGLAHLLTALEAAALSIPVIVTGTCYEYAPQHRPLIETDPVQATTLYNLSKNMSFNLAYFFADRIPITYTRIFNMYGEHQHSASVAPSVIDAARQGKPVDLTAGEQMRDYMSVDDAAEGLWRILAAKHLPGAMRILNLATGHAITLRTFLETLATVLQEFDFAPQLNFGAKPYRSDEAMNVSADITKMRAVLDWEPQTRLIDGLRHMVRAAVGAGEC